MYVSHCNSHSLTEGNRIETKILEWRIITLTSSHNNSVGYEEGNTPRGRVSEPILILPHSFLRSTKVSVTSVLDLLGRAPVAQSAATRAVNPGVMRSNPSSANILSDVWQKSLWHSSFTNGLFNSLCRKAASCLERMLCGVLLWENQETHE